MSLKLRLKIIYLGFLVIALLIVGRFFYLQVFKSDYFKARVKNQAERETTILTHRGEIYMQDKNGSLFPLAQNKDWYSLYVVPKEIKNPEETEEISNKLSLDLNIDKNLIFEKLNLKNDPYELIKKRLTDEEFNKIRNLKQKGVYIQKEYGRYYPNKEMASHLIGFLSLKENIFKGQYGLEEYYNEYLSGESGNAVVARDTFSNWIFVLEKKIKKAPTPAYDLILTIDPNIQNKAEEELKKLIEEKKARSGSIIVMNPKNGDVLAMASFPNFDPNNYSDTENIKYFLNPVTQSTYEPGSTFKPITFAASLEEKVITPETTYEDRGFVKIANRIIKNYDNKIHGLSTMRKVIEYSINTGAVFAASRLPKEKFYEYIEKFGFNKKTGIDLFETVGSISNLKSMRDINYATASFGQGISTTPLRLITAINTIANNGLMVTPHIVYQMVNTENKKIDYQIPKEERIISKETSLTLASLMMGVVDNGSGQPTKINGYSISGKTGTAQIPNLEDGGYIEKYIHTFVGFTPTIDPKFSILIKLDEPPYRSAAATVVPGFKNLAQYLFSYYEIAPDRVSEF